jgi:hypothetical protein
VVPQLGARKPRHGPQLRTHRREPLGPRQHRPTCALLQALIVEINMDGCQFVSSLLYQATQDIINVEYFLAEKYMRDVVY